MKTYNVLFLCTGNSARSVIGEALVRELGGGRFQGFSAGSDPKGEVHPMAIRVLAEHGCNVSGLRSKSWDEFARGDAPVMDFVFTVCGNAAGEVCPVWPGHPVTAHWGIDDPAAQTGAPEESAAFERAYALMEKMVRHFVSLDGESSDPSSLQKRAEQIEEEARSGNGT